MPSNAIQYRVIAPQTSVLSGIEILDGRFYGHRFAKHSHEEYALGIVRAGHTRFFARRAMHDASPGDLLLHNAGSVHTGEPVDRNGWRHQMLYLPVNLVSGCSLKGNGDSATVLPAFRASAVSDPIISHLFRLAFAALTRLSINLLTAENLLCRFAFAVTSRWGKSSRLPRSDITCVARRLSKIRDLIQAEYLNSRQLSLTRLSREAEFTPAYLVTAFGR